MILDPGKFIAGERAYWEELEATLKWLREEPGRRLGVDEVRRLHYLYQRTAADLARFSTFSAEPEIRRYLEDLVAEAYGEIHAATGRRTRFSPLRWFFVTFPKTFRRHAAAFFLAMAVMTAGSIFGGMALLLDEEAKEIIMPFSHLLGDPSERVASEEARAGEDLAGQKTTFSAVLMTNNTRVSILTLASGILWGVGTVIILFYNGAIIGSVAVDYVAAGELVFLLAWLLPHGSVEIPAILIAAQGGLLLARAMIGKGNRQPLPLRLREVGPDLVTLIAGVAILLVWAGIVEAFFSQYHAPVLPYSLKILFGLIQLILLALFLTLAGRTAATAETPGIRHA